MSIKSNKKVLLIDTGFSALPIYEYLVSCCFDVWVMGNRSYDVLAKKAGTKWINQDYSKVDEVREHIKSRDIQYVVPGCTDVSIDTCIDVGLNSGLLDSVEANRALGNKSVFRELCATLSLSSPSMVSIDEFPMNGQYICKPADSFSGRGVTIFNGEDKEKALNAIIDAQKESLTNAYVIETFAEGQLYSYSSFIEEKKVVSSFVVKEGCSANEFAVDTSYVVDNFPIDAVNDLKESVEKIAGHLDLKDGLVHVQFIYSNNEPVLIEIARRCPGDLYSLLIEYSTGYKYAAKYASYFVDGSTDAEIKQQDYILRHTLSSETDDVLGGLEFELIENVRAMYPLQTVGEDVVSNQKTRIGLLFTSYSKKDDLVNAYDRYMDRTAYKLR